MKTVLIGITSGIAAYKMFDLIKLLRAEDINVEVILTDHATHMVSLLQIEKEIGKPVHRELYPEDFSYEKILENRIVDHIALADMADVFIIAPATANSVAKLANGIADDYLTTTALAVTAPTVVCPSMNVNMWNNPTTQKNIKTLTSNGVIIIEPEAGPLACGYEGKGRLAGVETMMIEIKALLTKTESLKGKTLVVTSGGTSEPLDAVRSLTNRSSGKMGTALAEAAFLRGAHVIYLRAENAANPRYQIENYSFTTADNLERLLERFTPKADVIFHAAAVSDFTTNAHTTKISGNLEHAITLLPRAKILNLLKGWNPKAYVVGFKAEYEQNTDKLSKIAEEKRDLAGVDMIIANDISRIDRGFVADTNEVILVSSEMDPMVVPLNTKRVIAETILDEVIKRAFA